MAQGAPLGRQLEESDRRVEVGLRLQVVRLALSASEIKDDATCGASELPRPRHARDSIRAEETEPASIGGPVRWTSTREARGLKIEQLGEACEG